MFEPFLRSYLDHFKYKSITTDDLRAYFASYFAKDGEKTAALATVDWEAWLNAPGMPSYKPAYDTTLADAAYALSKRWIGATEADVSSFNSADLASFGSTQIEVFLVDLLAAPAFPSWKIEAIDTVYGLTAKTSAEIRFAWQVWSHAYWSLGFCILPTNPAAIMHQGKLDPDIPSRRQLHYICGPHEVHPAALPRAQQGLPSGSYTSR